MEIKTVKIQKDSWLVNNSILVPNNTANRHYKEIQEWIANGNTPESEFTDEEILEQEHSIFRNERNILLKEADIEINKLVDNNADASDYRTYRQSLRDATKDWVMPGKPE